MTNVLCRLTCVVVFRGGNTKFPPMVNVTIGGVPIAYLLVFFYCCFASMSFFCDVIHLEKIFAVAGMISKLSRVAVIRPPNWTIASGPSNSPPGSSMAQMSGSKPRMVVSEVMMMGTTRS